MTFISYAQNYEDVMLWRALKHVQNGFYIDVGANDPNTDSVTKAFYDQGWSGINIEPLRSHYESLIEDRPKDINLFCAAGIEHGHISIWECDVRGWATASTKVIEMHKKGGHEGVFHLVPSFPLRDICAKYTRGDIHFLKIDVEGFEEQVIQGMDFKIFRPWIVVVEATKPDSTEESHDDWEPAILSSGYKLAYADGLNRFYISNEKFADLSQFFRYPPNVFDEYIRVQQLDSEARARNAEAKARQAQEQAMHAGANTQLLQAPDQLIHEEDTALKAIETDKLEKIKALDAELEKVRQELHNVHQWNHHHWQLAEQRLSQINALLKSESFRITAPLRWTVHHLRLLRAHNLTQGAKAVIKSVLLSTTHKIKRLADRFPTIKTALRWLLLRSSFLAKLASRFSDTPISAALLQKKHICHFEELRSARIMLALSQQLHHTEEGPVMFLEVSDDVR